MRIFPLIAAGLLAGLPTLPAAAQQLAQAAAPAAARAGVAAAVKGDVKLAAVPGVRAVGKDAASGDPIFLGDRITTGGEGRLQIMLLDETVFTIGPNAALVIDQFVFDPQTSAGKVTASVLKGTFRFVTGKVAKREPSDMEVKLPVGSIGVRGTSVAGEVGDNRATIVLLGPGPETSTNERVGRILVSGTGAAGAAPVEIVRPGFATEIAGLGIPPTPPVRLDPGRLAALTQPLAGTGPRPAPPAPPQGQQGPTQQAQPPAGPQPGPGPTAGPIIVRPNPGPTGPIGPLVKLDAPPLRNDANFLGPKPPELGEKTTFEQLRSISSGKATFTSQTIQMATSGGAASYTISYSYDFGSRSANGGVTINVASGFGTGTPASRTVALLASPFNTGTGNAHLVESINIGPGALNGGNVNVDYGFINSNNVVFKSLAHKVTFQRGGDTGQGQGITTRP